MTTSRDIDYLQRALQLNPSEEFAAIVDLRNAWHNNLEQPPALASTYQSREDRYRDLLNKVDNVRRMFWTLDDPTLQRQLDPAKLNEFADLSLTGELLRSVSLRRDACQRLKQHPHCFPEFFDAFCEVVIAAPRESVTVRKKLETAARHGVTYPTRRSRQEYRRLANTIQKEFPELASLQPKLLAQIASGRFGTK